VTNASLWDDRYATHEHVFGTEPNDFLVEVAAAIPAGPVLCLGDGEGRNGVWLAGRGHAVTSVDQSRVGLAKAERLAEARGTRITTVVADVADLDLGSGWAAVVSIFCHVPSALRATLYPRCAAALAPGGAFVLEAYTPAQIGRGTGGPAVADLTPTAAELAGLMAGLVIERLEERECRVVEGPAHTGDASVVQLVARRPR